MNIVVYPMHSPCCNSWGFCGSSRRILLFEAHSLLKDMAAVNNSVAFKEELDTNQGMTHPATLRGPGQHVRGAVLQDGRQIPADGRHLGAQLWIGTGRDGVEAGTGCCPGSPVIVGCTSCVPTEDSLALPWYQEFNTFYPLQGPRFNICCFCPQCCFCPHCNPFFSCCPISALYIQQCWPRCREWQQTEQRVRDRGRSWRWRPQQCCIHPV